MFNFRRPAASYIPLGLLSVRSKPHPFLTKGEKKRVIQTTSMILSATVGLNLIFTVFLIIKNLPQNIKLVFINRVQ